MAQTEGLVSWRPPFILEQIKLLGCKIDREGKRRGDVFVGQMAAYVHSLIGVLVYVCHAKLQV